MKIQLKNCCGCCDLHLGTIIVGIVGIILDLASIISHSVALGEDSTVDENTRGHLKIIIGYLYLNIVINALLVYGAIKENRYFLLPWLIYEVIGLVAATLIFFIAMFFYPIFIILLFLSAGGWYIWLCVFSYFQELNPTNPPPNADVYAGATQITTMQPSVVSYTPQPPAYTEVGKGPQVV